VMVIGEEAIDQVAPDEPGPTGNKQLHTSTL